MRYVSPLLHAARIEPSPKRDADVIFGQSFGSKLAWMIRHATVLGSPSGAAPNATEAASESPQHATTAGVFGTIPGYPPIADIHALSHEVAESLDDPFVINAVQPWLTPTAPQYGCTTLLETGDPVVGIGFNLGGYTPEDEVFWPWFLRQSPSSAVGGRYTLMGPFNTFNGFHIAATGCN